MNSRQDANVLVITPSYQYFCGWCKVDADPQEDPRDPKFILLYGRGNLSRGFNRREQDRFWIIGLHKPEGIPHLYSTVSALLPTGFTDAVLVEEGGAHFDCIEYWRKVNDYMAKGARL